MRTVSHKEEAEHLQKRSAEFLKTAEYQLRTGLYGLAAFSYEHRLQPYLKALLAGQGVDYPRTHSVRRLLELLAAVSRGARKRRILTLLDQYLLELGMLDDAYITSRYLMRDFSHAEVAKLRGAVERITQALRRAR